MPLISNLPWRYLIYAFSRIDIQKGREVAISDGKWYKHLSRKNLCAQFQISFHDLS
jgi:hypothetical protein